LREGGESPEDAIVIKNAENHRAGAAAEYLYLQKRFGKEGVDWRLVFQALLTGDKPVDQLSIALPDGTIKDIYFDISAFFGKG